MTENRNSVSIWCELCRDHFDVSHWDEEQHKVGAEFGWVGERKARLIALEWLLAEARWWAEIWRNTGEAVFPQAYPMGMQVLPWETSEQRLRLV